VFLSERLYFGLVASLLPIDTPNRHPGGCRFSFSPYGWQERDVSTYAAVACYAEHEHLGTARGLECQKYLHYLI
jgi:hypothetical protein